jgi:hypothetical protein
MSVPHRPTVRRVHALLAFLVFFDATLTTWAFFFPQRWFDAFHGVAYVDVEALVPRMAANWAAFFLVQLIALLRWRRESWWLLVVAGVRLSDVFTDLTYFALAKDLTLFARLTLPGMGPINALMGWYLIRAWRQLGGGAVRR